MLTTFDILTKLGLCHDSENELDDDEESMGIPNGLVMVRLGRW